MKKLKYIFHQKPPCNLEKERVNWLLEFDTKDPSTNPFMGWESSKDTMGEVKLEFSTKEKKL